MTTQSLYGKKRREGDGGLQVHRKGQVPCVREQWELPGEQSLPEVVEVGEVAEGPLVGVFDYTLVWGDHWGRLREDAVKADLPGVGIPNAGCHQSLGRILRENSPALSVYSSEWGLHGWKNSQRQMR